MDFSVHTTNENLIEDRTDTRCNTVGAEEIDIPIETEGYTFQFTRKWFRFRNRVTWSTFLPNRFPPTYYYNAIQIGVFEGMDLVWCMQNCFYHPHSRIIAIDPWMELDENWPQAKMERVHRRAIGNLSPWERQIQIIQGKSQEYLPRLIGEGETTIKGKKVAVGEFDLVVIDGLHRSWAVEQDAENALKLLKPGGWMLFDDVRNRMAKMRHVRQGIDRFLVNHDSEVKLLWQHRHCDCFEKLPNGSESKVILDG